MSTFAIKADRFVLAGATMQGGYLTIEDGKFGAWSAEAPAGVAVHDLTGCIVGPGLVDTHIHGFFGHATTDRSAEGINASSVELARRGTTAWLPTTFTESVDEIADSCAAIAKAEGEAKSIELTTKAKNDALMATATAQATATKTRADAEKYRIDTVNSSLEKATPEFFENQSISAFSDLAKSPANVVVVPKDGIADLGQIPAIGAALRAGLKTPETPLPKAKN